jgi:hypothetical protein
MEERNIPFEVGKEEKRREEWKEYKWERQMGAYLKQKVQSCGSFVITSTRGTFQATERRTCLIRSILKF